MCPVATNDLCGRDAVPERAYPGELSWSNRLGQELAGWYRIPWGYSLGSVQGLSLKSLNNIFLSILAFCLEIEKGLLREPPSELSSALAAMSGSFLGPHQAESSRWSFQHP